MKQLQNRQLVIKGIFLLIAIIFVSKLFYIQIVNSKYKFSANKNSIRFEVQQPARGLIYDRDSVLIVTNVSSYDLMIIPREVTEMDTLKLCELADLTIEVFRNKLKNATSYSKHKESVFSKQLDIQSAHKINEALNEFSGFYIRTNTTRDYPINTASHTLGFLGEVNQKKLDTKKYYTKGDLVGISGIEAAYEEELRGEKGMKMILVNVFNRAQGSFNNGEHDTLAIQGKNIVSTLDIELQQYGEKLIQNKIGAIVAIHPSTGEILSVISSPNYNPNILKGRKRSKNYSALLNDENLPLFNRALSGSYPPASSFKLINGLIALQEGTLTNSSTYFCNGNYIYGNNKSINCHHTPELIGLSKAITISCNSYFCNTFEELFNKYKTTEQAYNIWSNHLKSFGLGNFLDNDFTIGNKGFIPNSSYFDNYYGKGRWKYSTIISMAIGQGELGVTPMQMANFTATIANRGFYYTPHIVQKIEGSEINEKYKIRKYTSIKPEHFETIIKGMEMVLTNIDGTAKSCYVEGITICGKTGTAQNHNGKDHSVFIAFAPKDNPEIAIAVYIENGTWGASWAAPIATLMIEKYLTGKISNVYLENKMINGNLLDSK